MSNKHLRIFYAQSNRGVSKNIQKTLPLILLGEIRSHVISRKAGWDEHYCKSSKRESRGGDFGREDQQNANGEYTALGLILL